MFKDSQEKENRGEVAIISNACETTIHENNQEGINDLLDEGYCVDDDRLPSNENKYIPT